MSSLLSKKCTKCGNDISVTSVRDHFRCNSCGARLCSNSDDLFKLVVFICICITVAAHLVIKDNLLIRAAVDIALCICVIFFIYPLLIEVRSCGHDNHRKDTNDSSSS